MNLVDSAGFGIAVAVAAVVLLVAATIVAEAAGRRRTIRWLAGTGITLTCASLVIVIVRFAAVLLR